ncbi:hypothetical protein ES708_34053 [subsurface metagenome]
MNKLEGKLPKVYQVTSVVKKYKNYKEVTFSWFFIDRKKPLVPYKKGIMNYVEGDLYPEGAIDELFTNREAKRLVAYLEKEHKDDTLKINIDEQKLPIANNLMGYGGIAVGGMTDFYMLDKEKDYNLPFKAWGYFDLRNCKNVNEEIKESEKYESEHDKRIKELGKLSIQELNERKEVIMNEKEAIERVIEAKNIINSYKESGFLGVYIEIADKELPF